MTTRLLPLFFDLRGRRVLVVGAGSVAARKIAALADTGAEVMVGAIKVGAEVRALAEAGAVALRRGAFADSWLDDVWLVIAATNDAATNARIAAAATARRLFVNTVDDRAGCSAQFPAVVQRGLLQIAISTAGAAPMLGRAARERVEALFDESWAALAQWFERHRARIRSVWPEPAARRHWFERCLHGPIPGLLRAGREAAADRLLDTALAATACAEDGPGSVVLVGAGPGDPGLLTLRGLRELNTADVIVHDHLVSAEVLALARRDARRIDVGKQAGEHSSTQDRINALLIALARGGERVLRLKGGDPFVFGRGGEELQALRAAGIRYEVVPGITAALACAAYAGIPLTHREHAQSLRLITAHSAQASDQLDWAALAAGQQTLVFYMGVASLERIRARLLEHGADAGTAFALIENGSRNDQRVVHGTLAELPALARLHRVQSPALLIIGAVAALASELSWFGSAPLGSPAQAPALPAARPRLPALERAA